MEELVNEITDEVMAKLKERTKFWSPYWKEALRDKLVRKIEAHLTQRGADSLKAGRNSPAVANQSESDSPA